MTNTTGLVQSGTKTFVVGTVSGIDTSALVEIAVQAVTSKADDIDDTIDENIAKMSAYAELKTLTQAFQDSFDSLSGDGTYFDDTNSIFDTRSGILSTNDGTSSSGYMTVSIDEGAPKGSYEIEIIRKATAHKVVSGAVTDADADLSDSGVAASGTFDIGLAGGATETISFDTTTSLNELAAAINDVSDTTGVSAAVVKTSETEYQLILTATETAKDIEITNITGEDVMTTLGVTDGGGGYNDVLQISQNAEIKLDGVSITRDDNDFSDVISGIGITVDNESAGTIYTLTVTDDTEGVRSEIEAFVEAYNKLRDFMTTQSVVSDDGAVDEDSILFSDNIMDTIDLYMSTLLASSAGTSGSTVTSLRDLGLKLSSNMTLEFITDPEGSVTLDDAILNNLDDVRAFFSTSYTDDNELLALLANDSQMDYDFTLDITVDGDGNITSAGVGGDTSLFTIDGTRIIGAEGSIYEGLRFSYQDSVSASVSIQLTQGLGTKIDNVLSDFTASSTGVIDQIVSELSDTNDTLTAESTRIREIGEEVRTREIERYAAMEAAMQANELLVRQIKALFGTNNDDE